MSFRLEANESISIGMRRLLLERTHQIIDDLTNPATDRDKGVHEARKNCKRIRAAYRLIRFEIGDEIYRQENTRFRDAARLLAGARDDLVMMRTLDRLIAENRARLPKDAFAGIRRGLTARYEATLARGFQQQNVIPGMAASALQIENLPIRHQNFTVFRGGLQRNYTQGRVAMQQAYRQPGLDAFHEWRKRVKYLWHQIEILEALWPNMLLNLANELHALSEFLGDDHDLAVLRRLVLEISSHFGDERELMRLVHLIDQKRLELEALARPLGERIYSDRPKSFVQRLETYWKAWQSEAQTRQDKLIYRIQQASPAILLDESAWFTTAEIAERLEISPEKVRKLIHTQKLPAEKVGTTWIIKSGSPVAPDHSIDAVPPEEDALLSTRQAAERLGRTPTQIRELIQTGALTALKVGRVWVLRAADLPDEHL